MTTTAEVGAAAGIVLALIFMPPTPAAAVRHGQHRRLHLQPMAGGVPPYEYWRSE